MSKQNGTEAKAEGPKEVRISPPKMATAEFLIVGSVPYCQNRFSAREGRKIAETQGLGSVGRKGRKKDAKDFQALYEEAKHISTEGWCGIPAGAFRNAMISACRLVAFKMTLGKLSVFVEADGFDRDDGTPLVRIIEGEPRYAQHAVRNATGVLDLRPRPMWDPGWKAKVRVRFDEDQFSLEDVTNLMLRVGMQIGVGEGRPDSRMSCGMGWGLFDVQTDVEMRRVA